MNTDDYYSKMNALLSDNDTYSKISKDPTKSLTAKLKDLLVRWKKKEYLSDAKYRSLLSTDGILLRAYGLPKTHKKNCPLRIIVSYTNCPLYPLSSFLHEIIHNNILFPESHILNSSQLVNALRGTSLDPNFQFASLDAVSLFTNVPTDLAIQSIRDRWDDISKGTSIPIDEFLIAINFVLSSTCFSFGGHIYKQIFGTLMGSPISMIVADLVLQDIESKALSTLNRHIPIYCRHVDDIILASHPAYFNDILNTFNSFHSRLQFTIEHSNNNSINFLDISIIFEHGNINLDWYHKPTFSGRYLNFFSHHPTSHKRGVIFGLTDKVLQISDPQFHKRISNF
ncbi:hypothetical protein DMN91_005755 [Ooceraea biroi]|uniref:Reverse transcriptase domain-containing protein n=1 Tax=Ooceraea biroi TaxID=2015173 RepID=A0A3L8DMH1_OOCBI|nr:hypothetical protein DMN91_005502 [Ooceraea biroi]RLU21382.1 hypothetical protein DMN91_005755 [Ooceraea biroi]